VNDEVGKCYTDRSPARYINLESGSSLQWTAALRTEIADLYRRVGAKVAMTLWEDFLVNGNLKTTAKGEGEIQHTWLLRHFLNQTSTPTEELTSNQGRTS
jgi:hypothetical protein